VGVSSVIYKDSVVKNQEKVKIFVALLLTARGQYHTHKTARRYKLYIFQKYKLRSSVRTGKRMFLN
jgi:hypothetical protein